MKGHFSSTGGMRTAGGDIFDVFPLALPNELR
jgi:hypothetical protein